MLIKIDIFKLLTLVIEYSTYIYQSDRDDDDMQSDINKIVKWYKTWFMELSPEKCKVMH